jgi:hypothetical protein
MPVEQAREKWRGRRGFIGWLAAPKGPRESTLGWLVLLFGPVFYSGMRIDIIPYLSNSFNRNWCFNNTS